MQPNNPQEVKPTQPVNAPANPNNPYGFIINPAPPSKKPAMKLGLGGIYLPGGKKLLLLGGGVVLIIIIILAILLSGSSANSKQLSDLVARQQELIRVSKLVEQKTTNPATRDLAVTTDTILSSEQYQLNSYLKGNLKSLKSSKNINLYQNKATDTLINSAVQDNQLDSVYANYLKINFATYQTALQNSKTGAGKKALVLINNCLASLQIISHSPALTASGS